MRKVIVALTIGLAAVASAAMPAQAETVALTTEQSEFDAGVPNQGWWSDTFPNFDANPN
jgi:hypothetical protein